MQEFFDFINQNIGLIGVIIGALLSLFVQVIIANRERKWKLQDEKRNIRIARLEKAENVINDMVKQKLKVSNLYVSGLLDNQDEKTFINDISSFIGQVIFPNDQTFNNLYDKFFDLLAEFPDKNNRRQDIELIDSAKNVVNRLSYLIEQEYNEKPSNNKESKKITPP